MRQRARLGTGVLAVALLAPAADARLAGATEPTPEKESEYEGGNDPDGQGGDGDGGGDLTNGQDPTGPLHDDNSPVVVAPGAPADPADGEGDNGPVETDVDGEPVATPPPVAPAPPASAPAPPAQPAPAPTTPSQVDQPVPAPRSGVAPVRRPANPTAERGPKKARKRVARQPARPAPVRRRGGMAPAPKAAAPTPQAPPATVPATTPTSDGPTHTVRSGDTLWSIAAARLGDGATPAQIAREVQRIWNLNAKAIGTGDPSLIGVGVELRLR